MIANWVKEARTSAGLSGTALGARLALELGTERGHTKANISHWENEKHSPNLKQLLAISRVTGCRLPPDILAPLAGSPLVDGTTLPGLAGPVGLPNALRVVAEGDDDAFVPIPMVKLRLSAGITGYQTEPEARDGGTLGMRRTWLERNQYSPSHLIAIYVKGESMEPSLYAGDIVVINTLDTKPVPAPCSRSMSRAKPSSSAWRAMRPSGGSRPTTPTSAPITANDARATTAS